MNRLFEKVAELRRRNALHRRGFHMNEPTPERVAFCCVDEAAEVNKSVAYNKGHDAIVEELADVLCTVCHLAILHDCLSEAV